MMRRLRAMLAPLLGRSPAVRAARRHQDAFGRLDATLREVLKR
jgi:hypothetical protein